MIFLFCSLADSFGTSFLGTVVFDVTCTWDTLGVPVATDTVAEVVGSNGSLPRGSSWMFATFYFIWVTLMEGICTVSSDCCVVLISVGSSFLSGLVDP